MDRVKSGAYTTRYSDSGHFEVCVNTYTKTNRNLLALDASNTILTSYSSLVSLKRLTSVFWRESLAKSDQAGCCSWHGL